jgi:hypothetical protein
LLYRLEENIVYLTIETGGNMELAYTYWEAEDGLLVGYLNVYPDHLTQGHDLAELEEMLADLYHIRQEEEKRLVQKRKSGILRLKVSA